MVRMVDGDTGLGEEGKGMRKGERRTRISVRASSGISVILGPWCLGITSYSEGYRQPYNSILSFLNFPSDIPQSARREAGSCKSIGVE